MRLALPNLLLLPPPLPAAVQAYRALCLADPLAGATAILPAGELAAAAAAAAAGEHPAWCSGRLPSVYGFIQSEYWDVGLLRFYRDPARVR